MADAVRVGVLGCSTFAVRRMLPAMARTPGLEIGAVASRTPARAEEVAGLFGARATGYEELLASPDIDVAYVPLPTGLHAEWIERALLAGKHVLGEKALTTSARDTARLVGLARAVDLVLEENFMFVHHPQHRVVRDWLADGRLGQPRVFSAAFGIPPRAAADVRYRPDLGGGALLDVGVYPIRATRLFLPGPFEVLGADLRVDPATGVDTRGHVLLRSASGETAELSFGFEHSYRSSYHLWGDTGRAVVDRAYTPPPDEVQVPRLHGPDGVHEATVGPVDQAVAFLSDFADRVRSGRRTGADLLAQAELVDQIRARAFS
ncbi:oxidoreductase [Longispora fulva]|uniref:Putative dehydrogenase n=1 Tax=Longispora fulva TaxID=619741 RepID=A0A8J7KIL3_9ACTN|nr:Gfo/Idh/MocA family oxidoreductase [Longispora fulva]MBG6134226.1 putative dehydrogenase [Longispora fulva]GIG63118.1 oxidoreductase [Longispora fulva]